MVPAFILILAAAAYRMATGLMIHSGATWLSNLSPLAAVALCGAVYFPTRFKFAVPLFALLISDIVLDLHYHVSILSADSIVHYFAFALVGCVGLAIQHRPRLLTLLPASIVGSTIFYLVTNAFCWLSDPGYAKTGGGLIQALTVGLPAYSATPAWMFYRNSLVSDLLFTLLFVACISLGRTRQPSQATAAVAAGV